MLKDSLQGALQVAMRARDQVTLDTIRMVLSAVKYKEIEKKGVLTEAELTQVLASLCKQRRESMAEFRKGGREDLVAKETAELKVLEAFLPQQLPPEEVEKKVREAIQELGVKDPKGMGLVMKHLRDKLAGQVDGQFLSDTVRRLLQNP